MTEKGVPEGYHSVTPFVITRDASALLDFTRDAFGAQEMGRVADENGVIGHAETRIGDSVIMMFDARPHWPDTPAFLRLYVEDGDVTFARALQAGAKEVSRMTDMPWGDRVGRVRDPLGNPWWIMTRVEDLAPEEMERRAGLPEYVAAMEYVQSAEPFPPAD